MWGLEQLVRLNNEVGRDASLQRLRKEGVERGRPEFLSPSEWPRTVEAATTRLIGAMAASVLAELRLSNERGLGWYHFGLGNYIRNQFGLWKDNASLRRSCAAEMEPEQWHGADTIETQREQISDAMADPDRASEVIIKALWERLQGVPLPLKMDAPDEIDGPDLKEAALKNAPLVEVLIAWVSSLKPDSEGFYRPEQPVGLEELMRARSHQENYDLDSFLKWLGGSRLLEFSWDYTPAGDTLTYYSVPLRYRPRLSTPVQRYQLYLEHSNSKGTRLLVARKGQAEKSDLAFLSRLLASNGAEFSTGVMDGSPRTLFVASDYAQELVDPFVALFNLTDSWESFFEERWNAVQAIMLDEDAASELKEWPEIRRKAVEWYLTANEGDSDV